MVNKILTAAGVAHRRSRYTGKANTYAVWMDDQNTNGPDGLPSLLVQHDITVELYESKPEDAVEAAIEAAIAAEGLQYTKQDRYWLATEQMYQVIYEFTYFEKRRI
jgi:hypothetical protein